ncbi:MAG: multidrug ABC transporter permease [Candidatus Chisholmbacteria bacterium RIFCSPHIGHO2_01_FULL_49_18]|uniref:Transport permease protein n=2 Tax=Candidatus Chisholmiibacteriota TaxID=1817900 RepID=A0A1G1VP50_9BACT|nr:MAG: multidrug ABC transporter permease [Candidatus Chisholmbacteria bacterium RIFCSPHIGHO2_01_FULL_49_18]OGY22514.1 MAG: multidrug ABC transporter permease [Candidatus Chisholmbacteria bacterium RIFCSPLOWO2_01_FULL_49_14]
MHTIYILWLRQLKRYWRSKSRIIGSLGQPLLFLVALGFGLGPIFERAGGGNYIRFLSPGIIGQGILFMAIFSGIELIWDRQFGFLKETLVAPVSRFEIMIGRTLGGATIALVQGVIVFLLTLAVGFRPQQWILIPMAIFLMLLISLFYTALGTAIASTMRDFHGFQLIMNFLVMPTFFLSGALFPLDQTPAFIRTLSSFNPLTYGVDGLRSTLVGVSHFGLGVDILVLSFVSLTALMIGSYLFSRITV